MDGFIMRTFLIARNRWLIYKSYPVYNNRNKYSKPNLPPLPSANKDSLFLPHREKKEEERITEGGHYG